MYIYVCIIYMSDHKFKAILSDDLALIQLLIVFKGVS